MVTREGEQKAKKPQKVLESNESSLANSFHTGSIQQPQKWLAYKISY